MATEMASMRLSEDLAARYSRLADMTGRTRSYYLRQALEEAIDRLEYEYGIIQQAQNVREGRAITYSLDEVRTHCGISR